MEGATSELIELIKVRPWLQLQATTICMEACMPWALANAVAAGGRHDLKSRDKHCGMSKLRLPGGQEHDRWMEPPSEEEEQDMEQRQHQTV